MHTNRLATTALLYACPPATPLPPADLHDRPAPPATPPPSPSKSVASGPAPAAPLWRRAYRLVALPATLMGSVLSALGWAGSAEAAPLVLSPPPTPATRPRLHASLDRLVELLDALAVPPAPEAVPALLARLREAPAPAAAAHRLAAAWHAYEGLPNDPGRHFSPPIGDNAPLGVAGSDRSEARAWGVADVAGAVLQIIVHYPMLAAEPQRAEPEQRLLEEAFVARMGDCIEAGQRLCPEGIATRLVSTLQGYVDGVAIDVWDEV